MNQFCIVGKWENINIAQTLPCFSQTVTVFSYEVTAATTKDTNPGDSSKLWRKVEPNITFICLLLFCSAHLPVGSTLEVLTGLCSLILVHFIFASTTQCPYTPVHQIRCTCSFSRESPTLGASYVNLFMMIALFGYFLVLLVPQLHCCMSSEWYALN